MFVRTPASPVPPIAVLPAPRYTPPIPRDGEQNDVPVSRVDDDALPLAHLVATSGQWERAHGMVGFFGDGVRVRAADAVVAAAMIRQQLGATEDQLVAVLGSTPNVFYGVTVHSPRAAVELLRHGNPNGSLAFDKVSPDLRAIASAETVWTFAPVKPPRIQGAEATV